jgi:hypothetical protein
MRSEVKNGPVGSSHKWSFLGQCTMPPKSDISLIAHYMSNYADSQQVYYSGRSRGGGL